MLLRLVPVGVIWMSCCALQKQTTFSSSFLPTSRGGLKPYRPALGTGQTNEYLVDGQGKGVLACCQLLS